MSALIIGGDKVQTIIKGLKNKGFNLIEHVSGRKAKDKIKGCILKNNKYDLVIVLTDYINHCLVANFKNNLYHCKVIYCRRSWPIIEGKLANYMEGKNDSI
ncbi:MAG: DUF2325 domain-containing protein [Caloramator sp.]|nr:DUF2325 domain-containing protein [Caloramator sp.]